MKIIEYLSNFAERLFFLTLNYANYFAVKYKHLKINFNICMTYI